MACKTLQYYIPDIFIQYKNIDLILWTNIDSIKIKIVLKKYILIQ